MAHRNLEKRPRRFKSGRCGYTFVKYRSALVEQCPKCHEPVMDMDYRGGLNGLDPYSLRKYYWYKYPKYWIEDIQNRKTVGGKTFITDNHGNRIGEAPQLV